MPTDTRLSAEDVLALELAQHWTRVVKGARIFFTHPNNGGGMLVDLETQTVMVLNSANPSEGQISQEIEFQIKNQQSITLYPRLLQAEGNALSNNLKRPHHSEDPFQIFTHLMASHAIVEVISRNLGPTFVLLETADQLGEFVAVAEELKQADGERHQLLVNKIHLLTGVYTHHDNLHLVLGINQGGHYIEWQEAWVGEPPDLDDFGDTRELRQMRCQCGFSERMTYSYGDEGSRIGSMYFLWEMHRREHPSCHRSPSL